MSEMSREHLVIFLNWAAEKGLMKTASTRSLRSACNAVLSVMDEAEAEDVCAADLDSIFRRYQNLHSFDVSPNTMRAYRNRVGYAIGEFRCYHADKMGWRPSGPQRTTSSARSPSRGKRSERLANTDSKHTDPPEAIELDPSSITHRFPLRKDTIVEVTGIPFDIRRVEMARLTAYLSNLVAEIEDYAQVPPMLNAATESID